MKLWVIVDFAKVFEGKAYRTEMEAKIHAWDAVQTGSLNGRYARVEEVEFEEVDE